MGDDASPSRPAGHFGANWRSIIVFPVRLEKPLADWPANQSDNTARRVGLAELLHGTAGRQVTDEEMARLGPVLCTRSHSGVAAFGVELK